MNEKAIQGIDFLVWECDTLLSNLHRDRQIIMEMKDALEKVLKELRDATEKR